MVDYSDYWQGIIPDTVSSPDLINDGSTAIRSALWFWLTYKIYNADRGNGLLDVKSALSASLYAVFRCIYDFVRE